MHFSGGSGPRRGLVALAFVLAGFLTFRIARDPRYHPLRSIADTSAVETPIVGAVPRRNGTEKPGKAVDLNYHKDELYDEVRILCWIMTNPKNHKTKAIAVKNTWGTRCNKLIFMSSEEDSSLPSVALPVKEGRENLWEKSRLAWHYAYKHHGDDYDWYIKADDDCFVIVENLRYLGSQFNQKEHTTWAAYRKFMPFGGYASGGAGYAVSRGALKKLGPIFETKEGCHNDYGGVEDIQFGKCCAQVGVKIKDTRDGGVRHRFHPFVPEHVLIPNFLPKDFWYWTYSQPKTVNGPECCSDITISFHYVSPEQMQQLFFYVYSLHPYGYYKSDDFLPISMIKEKRRKMKEKER